MNIAYALLSLIATSLIVPSVATPSDEREAELTPNDCGDGDGIRCNVDANTVRLGFEPSFWQTTVRAIRQGELKPISQPSPHKTCYAYGPRIVLPCNTRLSAATEEHRSKDLMRTYSGWGSEGIPFDKGYEIFFELVHMGQSEELPSSSLCFYGEEKVPCDDHVNCLFAKLPDSLRIQASQDHDLQLTICRRFALGLVSEPAYFIDVKMEYEYNLPPAMPNDKVDRSQLIDAGNNLMTCKHWAPQSIQCHIKEGVFREKESFDVVVSVNYYHSCTGTPLKFELSGGESSPVLLDQGCLNCVARVEGRGPFVLTNPHGDDYVHAGVFAPNCIVQINFVEVSPSKASLK